MVLFFNSYTERTKYGQICKKTGEEPLRGVYE